MALSRRALQIKKNRIHYLERKYAAAWTNNRDSVLDALDTVTALRKQADEDHQALMEELDGMLIASRQGRLRGALIAAISYTAFCFGTIILYAITGFHFLFFLIAAVTVVMAITAIFDYAKLGREIKAAPTHQSTT